MLKKIAYYTGWFIKCKIGGQKIPLNSSIILTDRCNLSCRHCVVAGLGYRELDFEDVKRDIGALYAKGSRMLVITGGEPFLWRDGVKDIADVVSFARQKGFFRVVICTNGTFELRSNADYLWVSLDGSPADHISIRGDIYEQVMSNIKNSRHEGVYINYTVTSLNNQGLARSAEDILNVPNIKGILFHLFTPYIGSDTRLSLDRRSRHEAIKTLKKIKSRHPFRVSNTFSGLAALAGDNWQRNTWASLTVCNGEISPCCCRRGIYDELVCRQCGCTPAVETWVLQKVKPLAVLENLRFI